MTQKVLTRGDKFKSLSDDHLKKIVDPVTLRILDKTMTLSERVKAYKSKFNLKLSNPSQLCAVYKYFGIVKQKNFSTRSETDVIDICDTESDNNNQ